MIIPQLRVRTEFSFRQAFGPLADVIAALKALECPKAAMVDGGTWGHVKWASVCAKAGIQPLFGTELTVPLPDGRNPKAWALAAETKTFYEFSSACRGEDVDIEAMFAKYNGGQVVRFAGAGLTNPDCFDYVDINPGSPLAQRASLRLAALTNKPIVITSDNAYPAKSDYAAFMAAISREKVTPQHLLTEAELRAALTCLDDSQFAQAVHNTHEAAERCTSKLPQAPLISVNGDLRALTLAGKERRMAGGYIKEWTPEMQARMDRELKVIAEKQFESYFIVVADLVQWAKTQMLVGPGRGSSAGSLVCYLLFITEVNPLDHGLLFERFIDLNRSDLPDIDIDFNDQKRDDVFTYLGDKYGKANVARIGNINTLKPRSVMAQVSKSFGIPDRERYDVLNVLIEYSSGDSRYGSGIEDTLANTEAGRKFAEKYPEANIMFRLENHADHTGIHAAGVIVCNEPVSHYCTVNHEGIAHIDKPDSEALNLLKIDALGLRTLGVIEDAAAISNEELYRLPTNDPNVFDIFNNKRFAGIFQFEGQAQRRVSAEVHVKEFRQLDHVTALARPGPLGGGASQHYIARAAGREEVTYRHPSMHEYLGDTMGVVLYQEQVMRIVREIGQFSWSDTSSIRKAMSGRKGQEYFDRYGVEFVKGAATIGVPADEAKIIWDEICTFGSWGMNMCITGDTEVKLAHPNQFLGRTPTVAALYEYYKVNPSAWIKSRKAMPVLLCVGPDGVARPTMAVDIFQNGERECVLLEFDDGDTIECTESHRFIIDGEWLECGAARIGSEFSTVARDHSSEVRNYGLGIGQGWRAGREGGAGDSIGGKTRAVTIFRASRIEAVCGCEDCGVMDKRMQIHHNDFVGGLERPEDLAWLCDSCHKKRHIADGSRRGPYARGHLPDAPKVLVRRTKTGRAMTYDIEMPAPNHNYVLANGVVTHNSHTVSYAVISYWCAFMKRYHPLEYAAACLRNTKSDQQTIEVLRDMAAEGVSYTPFDIERSDVNWKVVDGVLVGGFINLDGVGPSKAAKAVEDRNSGKMTEAAKAKLLALPVKFAELYPLRATYGHIIDNPYAAGCQEGSVISPINALPPSGDVLLLCKVLHREARDENETLRLGRRGHALTGPTAFLDIMVTDDSGVPITLRIDRWNYEPSGRIANDNLLPEDVLLVRGNRIPNFAMVKIQRMKCINRPDALKGVQIMANRSRRY